MDWAQCFNEAIRFLENDLTQPPDVEAAARIAGCSVFHFQRMFAYVAGMPLSQYIRRRKMSLAAEELQNGGKITDVALRYGYASPTAFNRAFQAVHGIAPSEAKKEGAALRAYPPIRFSLALAGGTALEYRIERRGAFSIVGATGWPWPAHRRRPPGRKARRCLPQRGRCSPARAPCRGLFSSLKSAL